VPRQRSTFDVTIGEYLDRTKLTREGLAERLQLAGVAVSDPRRAFSPSKRIPKSWGAALGIGAASLDADDDSSSSATTPPPGREGERPPTEPAGAKQAPLPIEVGQLAAERIAQTYAFIGAGVGTASGNVRIGQVFDAYSPEIGKAWVRAAEENEFARRVVTLMSAGGATGDLVMVHVVLVGGLLYVSGRAPALEGLYGRRFGPPPVFVEPGAAAGDAAAGDPVGDAAGATQA
jgi:hypothetical protein